uniref:Uncharacterized protein n=1 Tax=Glossina palpalis gambiensis TaxID=67801 RepID=A0A1B0AQ00_9MUSC
MSGCRCVCMCAPRHNKVVGILEVNSDADENDDDDDMMMMNMIMYRNFAYCYCYIRSIVINASTEILVIIYSRFS